MLGFFAGLLLGRNCSRLAWKGSRALRQLADRLDRLVVEPERIHAQAMEHEKEMVFRPAA
jgi:hypothetical protein